ncbi:6916_t:CDS:2, partial [Cetraspora pellucida]
MPSDTIVSLSSETIKKFEASLQIIKNRFYKLQWDLDLKEKRLEKILRDSESQEDYIDYLKK